MKRILSIVAITAALTSVGLAGTANAGPSGLYAGSGSNSGIWSGQAGWIQDAFKPKQ